MKVDREEMLLNKAVYICSKCRQPPYLVTLMLFSAQQRDPFNPIGPEPTNQCASTQGSLQNWADSIEIYCS